MTLWVGGDDGVRYEVLDPHVGTPAGMKAVQAIWAGDPNGVRRLVFARLTKPTFTAVGGFNAVVLSWTSAGAGVTYRITRVGYGAPIYTGELLTYTDAGLNPSSTYDYQLEVLAPSGTVAYTLLASATTLDLVDLKLTATKSGWRQINLAWVDPMPAAGITYRLYRVGVAAPIYTGPLEAFQDTELLPAKKYDYNLIAVSAGADLQPVNTASATTDARVDMGLTASSPQWDLMDLSWTDASSDILSSARVTYYLYRYRYGSGNWEKEIVLSGTTKSYQDTRLLPSTDYRYELYMVLDGAVVLEPTDVIAKVATAGKGAISITAVPQKWSKIRVDWTDADRGSVDYYNVYRWNGNDWALIDSGWYPDMAHLDEGLPGDTAQAYRVDAYRSEANGQWTLVRAGDYVWSAKTPVRGTIRKEWSAYPTATASYAGNNTNRNVARCYYGAYDSTWGTQKSQARWDIPAEIRGCHHIESIALRWWNQHHFLGSGGGVSLSVHHNTNLSGNYGGSTGTLEVPSQHAGAYYWAAPRNNWINTTEWFFVDAAITPGRSTVLEEFRTLGAQGFELRNYAGGQSSYGYASTDPIMWIVYYVWEP